VSRRARSIGLAVRSASTTPALSLFAILIVAAIAFAGSAAPGLLQQVQGAGLRYALEQTDPTQRDFGADTRGAPSAGWAGTIRQVDEARSVMDPSLARILGPVRVVTEMDGSEATPLDPAASKPRSQLYLRYDPQLDDRVSWVDGRRPEVADPAGDGVRPVEFGLTAEAAQVMEWELGEERLLPRPGREPQRVVLVGIYEPVDPGDPDWTHVPLALQPTRVQRGLELPLFSAVAFTAPDDLPTPRGYSDFVSTRVWYPLELAEVRAGNTPALIAAMRRFQAQTIPISVSVDTFFDDGLQFSSTSPLLLTQAVARTQAMDAMVALIASGPLVVAVMVLSLVARMLALRRRTTLQLVAARGGSLRLRAALLFVEGAVLGGIGAAAGAVGGMLLGGDTGAMSRIVPVLAASTPAVALPVLGLLNARRRVRADLGTASPSLARVRLAVELTIVTIAAGAVALVLLGARSAGDGGPDPLLTVVPLLLAGVGCIIALRLTPLLLGVIERRAMSSRGLIALVGPARARRDPAVRVAPVLAVVVGVAIAVFSVAFAATVDSGIRIAAQSVVGADLRVQATFLNKEQLAAFAGIDGVRATAPVYADEQVRAELPGDDVPVTVYVIDVGELRAVQKDPESAVPLPDALTAGGEGPVPVVISSDLAARAGDEPLTVDGTDVRVVGTAPAQTPLGAARSWVAVDRSVADRLIDTTFSPAVVLIDLDPDADDAAVIAAARSIAGPGSLAATPASAAASRLEDPSLAGLQAALLAAIGVVAALLALAVGMTLVLGAPSRGRLLALLGALGFRRSRELALIVWEVAPAVALALPIGAAIGLTLPYLVIPAVDLTGFVGGTEQPLVRLGGLFPLWVVLGFLGVTVLAVLIAALVARRVTAAGTLRSIDEEG
jgi:putative ABC transport system permease protein